MENKAISQSKDGRLFQSDRATRRTGYMCSKYFLVFLTAVSGVLFPMEGVALAGLYEEEIPSFLTPIEEEQDPLAALYKEENKGSKETQFNWDNFPNVESTSEEKLIQANNYMKKFFKELRACKNLEKMEDALSNADVELKKIFESENQAFKFFEKYLEKHGDAFEAMLEKFRDEAFKKNGLILQYPSRAYYFFSCETEKKFFSYSKLQWMRRLRFKIAENPDSLFSLTSERVEAGFLVLLNPDKFEIAKIPVGAVVPGKTTTGHIELSERDYKEICSVEIHPAGDAS